MPWHSPCMKPGSLLTGVDVTGSTDTADYYQDDQGQGLAWVALMDAHSFSRAVLGDARRELRNLGYEKPKAEWGVKFTLKGRRSLSRPIASPRERLDHRKRPRTDPDVYLNAMGAALAQFKTTAKRSGAR